MQIALITGASSGIGREFSLQIAQKFDLDEIWLIARRRERLEKLEKSIKLKTRIIDIDLSDSKSFDSLCALLKETKPEIKILVNAAGFGKFGSVEKQALSDIQNMIDVNIKALTSVTKMCLPYMPPFSGIINMASVSAYTALPQLNIYSATKAYVLHFSQALSSELKKRNVFVTAVCPYWVSSEFIPVAENTDDGDCINNFRFITFPFPVVKKALKDNIKRKTTSLYGIVPKAVRCLSKILPFEIQSVIWENIRKLNNLQDNQLSPERSQLQ